MLLVALRALGRTWPTLLAWFLAGWIAHLLLLELAAQVGAIQAVYGFLILPLAVLARLASFVGMFLALRRALPHFPVRERREGFAVSVREGIDVLLESILPFFIIYAAWDLIDQDIVTYGALGARQAVQHIDDAGYANTPLTIPFGWLSVSLIVVAFAAKAVLKRFEHRAPRLVGMLAAYAEAVWVLVSVFVLRGVIQQVPGWLASRRMFAPIADLVAELRTNHGWVGATLDAAGWLLEQLGTVVAQPLAWVALAGVVYAHAIREAMRGEPGARRRRLQARWEGLPRWMRTLGNAATEELRERWIPIGESLLLLRRTGPIAIGAFLLAFAVVTAGQSWLQLAATRLLGPHELGWWAAVQTPMNLVIELIVVILQIVLVAAVVDRALATAAPAAVSAAAAPPERSAAR